MAILFTTLLSVFALATEPAGPQYKKTEIQIKNTKLTVELAQTEEQTSHGLMFRQKLAENDGMLFIFPTTEVRTFWMKNTFVPLSIGFFDDKMQLIDIQDMKPVKSEMETDLPLYKSAGPARYALEVPQGWFTKKKIKVGDYLKMK